MSKSIELIERIYEASAAGDLDALVGTAAPDQEIQYGRSRGTVRGNGATYDVPECHVWTVAGEMVTDVRFFIDTASTLEALER